MSSPAAAAGEPELTRLLEAVDAHPIEAGRQRALGSENASSPRDGAPAWGCESK
jgi:hypothetical protein